MKRRLQNKVAESAWTLPAASVIATLLWWLPQGHYSTDYLLGWIVCAVTTFLVLQVSDSNSLMRIRSSLNVAVYMLLMGACGFLHALSIGSILALWLVFAYFALFRSFDDRRSAATVFYTGVCLSLGSLFWGPMLLLLSVVIWSLLIYMRSISFRTAMALLLGCLLPYWIWAAVATLQWDFSALLVHHIAIFQPFHEPFYWQWMIELAQTSDWAGFTAGVGDFFASLWQRHAPELVASLYVTLLGLTGFIHYLFKSYDDTIRVRMYYYTILLTQAVLAFWLLMQPTFFNELFPMLILSTAPAAAHFFALRRTWLSNVWFCICALLFVGVAVICLFPGFIL